MKRLFLFALVLVISACPVFAGGKLRVVSTLPDYAWLAEQVGGDLVSVKALAKGSQDPHYVDAKPSYLPALHKADVLLLTGLDLEVGWLPPLLRQAGNNDIQPGNFGYVDLSQFTEPIEVPQGGADRSMGDVHPYGNPHFSLDPVIMSELALALAEVFARSDPENAEAYRANARKTRDLLGKLDEEIRSIVEPVRGIPIVTYHATQNYFFKRYGLHLLDFIEPKPGIKPSPKTLLSLEKKMKARGATVILTEPYQDVKIAERVAKDVGAVVVQAPSYTGGSPKAKTYPDLIRLMARKLAGAAHG